MTFDIKSFTSGFTSLEYFKGSDNTYFVAAKKDESKLGVSFEPATFPIPYKGKPTAARGLVLRGVMIGDDVFENLRERGGFRKYISQSGSKVQGSPLFRHLIPLTTSACSTKEFHALAEAAFAKLYVWLSEKVAEGGGTMAITADEFLIECGNALTSLEVTVPDLFHLPGVKPDWLEAPVPTQEADKPSQPGGDDDESSEDGDPDDE